MQIRRHTAAAKLLGGRPAGQARPMGHSIGSRELPL